MEQQTGNGDFDAFFENAVDSSANNEADLTMVIVERNNVYTKTFYGMGTYEQKTGLSKGDVGYFFRVSPLEDSTESEIFFLGGMSGKSCFERVAKHLSLTVTEELKQNYSFDIPVEAQFGIGQCTSKSGTTYYATRLQFGGSQ
jgi:hypothetical protein